MAHDVFISYSSKDKVVADAVCANLEARRIRCWIAPRDVVPGAPYAEALIDGLNQSRLLVLVFSANSNSSPQVIREVERAVNKGLPIIPLRIEDVIPSKSMEYFVSSSHWLDAMTPPLEKHLNRLSDTVQWLLSDNCEAAPPTEVVPQVLAVQSGSKKLIPLFVIIGCILLVAGVVGGIFLTGGFGRRGPLAGGPQGGSQAAPASTSSPSTTTPALPPLQTKNLPAGVLYADDFSNNGSGWPRFNNDSQFSNYDNGEYVLTGKKLGTNAGSINMNAGRFSDMVFEVEAKLASGPEQCLYGMLFRHKDVNNYYCFLLSGDGSYLFEKRIDGVFTQLTKKTFASMIKKMGTINMMKVVCKGSQIALYVNGFHLTDISDTSFSDGWIGVAVHPYDAACTARFNSIKISKTE
jgi:hypothetical protein